MCQVTSIFENTLSVKFNGFLHSFFFSFFQKSIPWSSLTAEINQWVSVTRSAIEGSMIWDFVLSACLRLLFTTYCARIKHTDAKICIVFERNVCIQKLDDWYRLLHCACWMLKYVRYIGGSLKGRVREALVILRKTHEILKSDTLERGEKYADSTLDTRHTVDERRRSQERYMKTNHQEQGALIATDCWLRDETFFENTRNAFAQLKRQI